MDDHIGLKKKDSKRSSAFSIYDNNNISERQVSQKGTDNAR